MKVIKQMTVREMLGHIPYFKLFLYISIVLMVIPGILLFFVKDEELTFVLIGGIVLFGVSIIGKILHVDYRDNVPFL